MSICSRRSLLQIGAGAAASVALSSCGAGVQTSRLPIAAVGATPVAGPVEGFDDPGRWAGGSLRVGGWGGEIQAALRDAVWQPFAAATGCTVEDITVEYSQLLAAIRAGRSYADLLLVDEMWAQTALDRGFVQPVDGASLSLDLLPGFDRTSHSVPALSYALVNSFRRDAASTGQPRTWRDWWDVSRFPGARALQRDPFGTFEFALMADGVAPESLYPLDGDRAIESLKRISGKIVDRWWDSGAQPVGWLGTHRTDFASAWHYRVVAGQRDGLAVERSWDQGLVVADHWVIPTGSKAAEIAVDCLRYAAAPEVQARLARRVPIGPITPAAFELLDARLLAEVPTSPANLPRLVRADARWWAENQGDAVQRFNSWLLGDVNG